MSNRNEIAQKFVDYCDELENDIYWSLIEAPIEFYMIVAAPVKGARSIAERIIKTTKEN